MPLTKYPIEISLGGAVEEGDVEELVQPPRMREAHDCASLKGGAYTKRDEVGFVGFSPQGTTGVAATDEAVVTVAPTEVNNFPPSGGFQSSDSNPAPFTAKEAEAFEPTEADAVKEHGDSATLVIDGVPRTLCAWNVDPAGAYTWTGLGDDVRPRQAPLLPNSVAADFDARPSRDVWWTYLPTGGAQYAVFKEGRQVGPERALPTAPPIGQGAPAGYFDAYTQSVGPVCFPRVRAFEDGDFRGFVTCAAISTPQEPALKYPYPPDPLVTQSWRSFPYGVRLSTRSPESLTYVGNTSIINQLPCAARDIMASAYPYDSPVDDTEMPDYVQPGFSIALHDEDGQIVGVPIRGDLSMSQNQFLRLPGPALDMVVRVDPLGFVSVYTLHVNYNMNRGDSTGPPPYSAQQTCDNMIRIIEWRLVDGVGVTFAGELYLNEPDAIAGNYDNRVPDVSPGPTNNGLFDWPAGLHLTEAGLVLTFSSTRYAIVPFTLNFAGIVWKDPFWAPGDLTRLKIGRQNGMPDDECIFATPGGIIPPMQFWYNRGDAFERRVTGDPDDAPRTQTTQMARGIWAGSFLTQPDEDGNRWIGVQTISDQYNVGAEVSPGNVQVGLAGYPWDIALAPQAVSGSIVHTLVDENLDPLPFSTAAGVIPGSVIASQGLYVEGIGHCVSIHACAPGDDRTGAQEVGQQTQNDVFAATNFLVTRRDLRKPDSPNLVANEAQKRRRPDSLVNTGYLPQPQPSPISGIYRGEFNYPIGAPYVSAVAIAQVLPYGQALGTYMHNPYQLRVNLRLDADDVIRWTAHQRYGIEEAFGSGSLQPPALVDPPAVLKPVGSSSKSAPYEISIRLQPELPQLVAAGGHVTVAGAAPMVTGGPQGFLAGIALQAVVDNVRAGPFNGTVIVPEDAPPTVYIETDQIRTASIRFPIPEAADALTFAASLSVYDELGAEHRTLPFYINLGYAYQNLDNEQVNSRNIAAILYAIPWQIAGIALSDTAVINFYQGNENTGEAPGCRATAHPPFVSHNNYRLMGPAQPSSELPQAVAGTANPLQPQPFDWIAESFPGTGEVVYTWSGELAADAPDPSRAMAVGGNRLWSVSSVDTRKVQYTKVLRKGYAPEWDQNVSVRIPSSPDDLTAVGSLPDGRILFFSATSVHYTYGQGPSDTGQGAGFAEPAPLSMDLGTRERLSVVSGDFGCMFRSDRGFYLIDRSLNLTYVGLPYEDTTGDAARVTGAAIDSLRSEVLFFTDRAVNTSDGDTWVFNTLRQQWSTFTGKRAISATELDGRPYWIGGASNTRYRFTEFPSDIEDENDGVGVMSLGTGWLPMGKVQGYGRTWEMQITGELERRIGGFSLSGLRVEVLYDYDETPAEVFDFDTPGDPVTGKIKLRFRPRKQKSEAIAFRMVEYRPVGEDDGCTGWRLDMLTLLVGVKAGLDKIAITRRST